MAISLISLPWSRARGRASKMVVALLGTRPATRPPALLTALVLLLVAADAIRLGVAQLRASASPPTGDKHQIRKLFKTARLHIRRNQLDEARPLLRRCLQIDGADAHSWLALATLEERSGDVEGAKRVYTSAHAVCPSNVRLLHAQGVLEARHGEASAARELFARAEALDPGSAYVAHAWGQLERRLGNSAAAMGVYRRAIDAKPNAEVCAAAAALEAQEGNVTAARGLYRQAVALALAAPPSAADADGDDGGCGAAVRLLLEAASLEQRTGELSEARDLLGQAAAAAPASTSVKVAQARLASAAGEVGEMRRILAEAAQLPAADDSDDGSGGFSQVYNAWAALEAHHGHEARAAAVLEEATARYPKDAALRQSLGRRREREGDSDGARSEYAAACEISPCVAAYVAWARLEEREGDAAAARNLYAQAHAVDANHGPLINAWAALELRAGDVSAARDILRRGSARGGPSVWHGWGRLEEAHGSLEKAAELYERGTRSGGRGGTAAPTFDELAYLWHSLGAVRDRLGQPAEARHAYESGLRFAANSSLLLLGAARSYERDGEVDRARLHYLRAVRADGDHAHAWHAWGQMEARLTNVDAARDLLARGRRRCPTHAALWRAGARLEWGAGKAAAARALYRGGAAACPKDAKTIRAWARFELHQGRLGQADALLRDAAPLGADSGPDAGELWQLQALLQLKLGQRRTARATLEEGLRRAPEHAPLYRVLGSMQDDAGEIEGARASFSEGLRLRPDYAPIYHAWARLEGRLGNWEGLQKIDEIARRAFPPAAPSPVSPGGDDASVGGGGGDDDSYSLDEVPPAMEDLDDIVI